MCATAMIGTSVPCRSDIPTIRPVSYTHLASHICKSCASLPAEKQAELMTLNRLFNLPWRLSKEQLSWLKNRLKNRRPDVRALAQEQYEMRFPPRHLEDEDVYKRQILLPTS